MKSRSTFADHMQGIDVANFNDFPNPSPRPASTFINPSFLTAHGLAGAQQDQYHRKQAHAKCKDSSLTSV